MNKQKEKKILDHLEYLIADTYGRDSFTKVLAKEVYKAVESQIKQSILKAIMEKGKTIRRDDTWTVGNIEISNALRTHFNMGVEEFESVIKEMLQTKTNEKD